MIIIKNQTIHELIVNVESSTFTVNPPLDIHQGDTCSHVMLIKLRNNEDFISIDEDITYKMFYYLTKDKHLIETSDVTVVNYYRGVLSHIVSNKVVEEFGSYTCYLRGYLGEEIISTVSFPIVISKTHDYEAKSNEVIITKEFYDELKKHLNNDEIHLSEEDRDFLDTFNDQIEELSQVLERNKKIKDYQSEMSVRFVDLPEGLLNLTSDIVLIDKDGESYVVNSPAMINHKVLLDTHHITVVSCNDVIAYWENNDEYKFNSLLNATASIIVDDELSITSENPVQNKVITNKINEIEDRFRNLLEEDIEISNLDNYVGMWDVSETHYLYQENVPERRVQINPGSFLSISNDTNNNCYEIIGTLGEFPDYVHITYFPITNRFILSSLKNIDDLYHQLSDYVTINDLNSRNYQNAEGVQSIINSNIATEEDILEIVTDSVGIIPVGATFDDDTEAILTFEDGAIMTFNA